MKHLFILLILFSLINSSLSHKTNLNGFIPRKIHQVWIGDNIEKWNNISYWWLEYNPIGWEHHLWNEKECRDMIATDFAWFLSYFDAVKYNVQKSDVCRYFILYRHGGFYADLDTEPLTRLDPIINEAYVENIQVAFLERSPDSQAGTNFYDSYLAIGFIASVPHAVFWNRVFDIMKERIDDGIYLSLHHQVIHQTGPNVVMTAFWRYHRVTPGIGLLSHEKFYPCDVVCMNPYELYACHAIQKTNPKEYPILMHEGKTWNNWFSYLLNIFGCSFPLVDIAIFAFVAFIFFLFYHIFYRARLRNDYTTIIVRCIYFIGVFPVIFQTLGRSRTYLSLSCILIQIILAVFTVRWPPVTTIKTKKFRVTMFVFAVWILIIFTIFTHLNKKKPTFTGKKVLFITAHPDDESMFFSPTIENLREQGWELHLLCMSHRNDVRSQELRAATKLMGFKPHNVHVNDFEDRKDINWNALNLSHVITDHAKDFDAIISFDSNGVTHHPNHQAVHHAFRKAAKNILSSYPRTKLFVLDTMNPLIRFLGPIPLIFTYLHQFIFYDTVEVFGSFTPAENWSTMSAHCSQWIWYRKLFVLFSSHQYYNELSELYSLQKGDRTFDGDNGYIRKSI